MRCRSLVAFLTGCLFASFAAAADIKGMGSGFLMYKSRMLEGVLPFDAARQTETHQIMRRLGQLSLRPVFNQMVAEIESETFPEFPTLVFIDNDNDTSADFFIYHTSEGPSDLYGSFYSLEVAGPPAWIVFPVGPAMDDNKEFLFIFTHWVDQNSDGKLDLVIQEDVDMNASGLPEANSSAWLIDEDFDGLIDSAMHCVEQACTEILPKDNVFDLRLAFQQGKDGGARLGEPFAAATMLDGLFRDLRAVTGRE